MLRGRGHRVVFIVEESFAGTLEAQGFEERLMRLTPPPETEEVPGQFWKEFIRDTAPVFRQPTIEQLAGFIAPTFQALVDGAKFVDERLLEIFAELQPDAIVEDNVVSFPALFASGRPWVRIASCNPAEIKDHAVPPVFSGLPAGRPRRLGRVLGRLPRGALRAPRRLQPVLPAARRPAASPRRLHPREPLAQPLPLSAGDRLPARPPARPPLAQPAGQRPRHRRRLGAARAARRRRRTRSSTSASARSARPTSS